MLGGPSRYPSHAVGFLIDYAAAQTVSGQRSLIEPGNGGDYLGLTSIPGTQCFAAAGSASKKAQTDFIDPHYVIFGRAAAQCTPPARPAERAGPGGRLDGGASARSRLTSATSASWRRAPASSPTTSAAPTPCSTSGRWHLGRSTRRFGCPINGPVTVNATADATHLVAESNEANNSLSVPITCHLNQPDLVVDRVYGNQEAADCTIYADIRNAGSGSAGASMTRFQDLAATPTFNELVPTPALAAGLTAR